MVRTSEKFGLRVRDFLLTPFFYHTKKSFFVIGLIALMGLGLVVFPWVIQLGMAIAIPLTIVGSFVTLITSLAVLVNSHVFGWESISHSKEYQEITNKLIYDDRNQFMGTQSLQYHESIQDRG